jgi:HK97 gp10 family phage protein
MNELGIQIEGLDNCITQLEGLPARIVKGAFGQALAAGAIPIVEALETRTPVDTGLLKESIQSEISISSEGKGGSLAVGFGKQGQIARLVEVGHRAVGHKPNKTDTGKVVQPHPFMRPALAASQQEAIEAFKTRLLASIEAGLKG